MQSNLVFDFNFCFVDLFCNAVVKVLLADDRVDTEQLDWYGNKAVGLTSNDEVKKLIQEHADKTSNGKTDNWQEQKLRVSCQMVPSQKQAEMIAYSQKVDLNIFCQNKSLHYTSKCMYFYEYYLNVFILYVIALSRTWTWWRMDRRQIIIYFN